VIPRGPGAVTSALAALAALACSAPQHHAEGPPPEKSPGEPAPELDTADEEERVYSDEELEQEEEIHEDPAALDQLISELAADGPAQPPSTAEPAAPGQPAIPVAHENWLLEDDECHARLRELGVRTKTPECDTTLVKAPVLLDGPIEGVVIRPRWARSDGVNQVMDCRLVLALVAVAREAKRAGITEVLFYSTYRPLKKPPDECKKGKAGASCRKAKQKYEKALARKHSQHRKGLAIDIRWFVNAEGETIDVLEHYEREDKQPPCEDEPQTDEGRFLKELACALHDQRVFNVILTPNANKAHHNHFHFDITPDSTWYVIK
jgi:hypothetical protein